MRDKVLEIDQGSEFVWIFRLKDEAGYVDLSGYSAALQVREKVMDEEALVSLTSGSGITLNYLGDNGRVRVRLTATQTRALTFDRGVFDLEIYPTGDADSTRRLVSGRVILWPEVTR